MLKKEMLSLAVISIGISSAIIEALILKKPVIFIPGIDYNWEKDLIPNEELNIKDASGTVDKTALHLGLDVIREN